MKVYLVISETYLEGDIPEVRVEEVYSSRKEAENHKMALEAECQLWTDAPKFYIDEREVAESLISMTQYKNVRVVVRRRGWDNGLMNPWVCGTNDEPCDMRRDKDGVWHGVFKNDHKMTREQFNEFVLSQCKEEE